MWAAKNQVRLATVVKKQHFSVYNMLTGISKVFLYRVAISCYTVKIFSYVAYYLSNRHATACSSVASLSPDMVSV